MPKLVSSSFVCCEKTLRSAMKRCRPLFELLFFRRDLVHHHEHDVFVLAAQRGEFGELVDDVPGPGLEDGGQPRGDVAKIGEAGLADQLVLDRDQVPRQRMLEFGQPAAREQRRVAVDLGDQCLLRRDREDLALG